MELQLWVGECERDSTVIVALDADLVIELLGLVNVLVMLIDCTEALRDDFVGDMLMVVVIVLVLVEVLLWDTRTVPDCVVVLVALVVIDSLVLAVQLGCVLVMESSVVLEGVIDNRDFDCVSRRRRSGVAETSRLALPLASAEGE